VTDVTIDLRVPAERRGLVWTLGFGAFGLAFSLSITAAFLPPVLGRFTDSRTLIGIVLGAEGIFALTLPLIVGTWSDSVGTRLGRRRPFMLAGVPPMVAALAVMGLMPNLWSTALIVLVFFGAYYIYEPPYRSLYPDLLPQHVYGRAQSVQHLMRGLAIGAALVGGSQLLHLWRNAPFLAAAVVTAGTCGLTIRFVHEPPAHARRFAGVRRAFVGSWRILREQRDVRRFLLANTCWETAFAAMRTFVVLYVTKGMHQPISTSTAVLAAVTVGYLAAAVGAGPLGDRLGLARVIFWASTVYAGGLIIAGIPTQWHDWYYGLIVPVAIAAGTVMTLAWGLLFTLMPADDRGAISGLATTTKGVALLLGPLAAGAAIDLFSDAFPQTNGYQVLWPVCALPILLAMPLAWLLCGREGTPASATASS
jgi:MFS family permease